MYLLKEWADKLDGREYRDELTEKEEQALRNQGLVIVFGASDDLCEFRGAINDEAGCFGGGTILLNQSDLIDDFCMNEQEKMNFNNIKVVRYGDSGFAWSYETEIPHETFNILEDGYQYCRGIIFDIKSLKELHRKKCEGV